MRRRLGARTRRPLRKARSSAIIINGKLPTRSVNKHTYGDSIAVSSGGGEFIVYKSFWANALTRVSYDQSTTTGDGSNSDAAITDDRAVLSVPRGVSEVSSLYNAYRVLESKARVHFVNYTTSGLGTVYLWGYVQYSHLPRQARPADIDEVLNNTIPGFKKILIQGPNSINSGSITLKYDARYLAFHNRWQTFSYANTGDGIAGGSTMFQYAFADDGADLNNYIGSSGTAYTLAGNMGESVEFVFGVCNVSEGTTSTSGRLNCYLTYTASSENHALVNEDEAL